MRALRLLRAASATTVNIPFSKQFTSAMAGRCGHPTSSDRFPSVLVIGRFTSPTAYFQSEYAGFYFDICNGYREVVALLKAELDWGGSAPPGSRLRTCADEEEKRFAGCDATTGGCSTCDGGGSSLDPVREVVAEEETKVAARLAGVSAMEAGGVDHIDYAVFSSATNRRALS